jgi:transcriptional regulator with XRE-family HTH domain
MKKKKRPSGRALARRRADPEFRAIFGDNVRRLRAQRRLTQTDLASLCRIDRVALSDMERGEGNVTLGTLQVLAEALKCDEADLLRRPQ